MSIDDSASPSSALHRRSSLTRLCLNFSHRFERYEEADYSTYGVTDVPDQFAPLFPDW